MMTDPIADLLTRIRNGYMARKPYVELPSSTLKRAVVSLLAAEGFVKDMKEQQTGPKRLLRVTLRYLGRKKPILTGIRRISRPGLRRYAGAEALPKVYGGRGVAIISTSKGVMTDRQAREARVGGEVLLEVW